MLKTTKIILTGVGVVATGTGVYLITHHYFSATGNQVVEKRTPRYYDTVPERDSSLEELNRILRDNQDAPGNIRPVSPISVEVYENIDRNSRLYDSLVEAGYIARVEDEHITRHSQTFGNKQDIKADRFLTKKLLKIFGTDHRDNDSLASELAEIKPAGSKIAIEFWESPVNYKGYRLGRDKMIVFGVIPEEVKIVKYNGQFYLVTINNIYEVHPCNEFCQLKPIKDRTLLANIMQNVH